MVRFFYQNPDAPIPAALHIGTVAAIYHDNRVLLDWRSDGDFWALVGGAMEVGESLEECIRREVCEETGLVLHDMQLLGMFSHPTRIMVAHNGRAVQTISIAFAGRCYTEDIRLSNESRGMRFFTQAEVSTLPIVPTHQMIVPFLFQPELWPVIK